MMSDRNVVWACIAIALVAAIVLFLSGRPVAPEPVFMRPVEVEGVLARRMDEGTFQARWQPMYKVSPMVVIHEVTVPTEAAVPPPARIVRRAALVNGICARHGLRRVTYGKRWRCRR
jgi:hypothetical protein